MKPLLSKLLIIFSTVYLFAQDRDICFLKHYDKNHLAAAADGQMGSIVRFYGE